MLTLVYRPTRFADLVGQDTARIVLQALVHAQQVPPALLFRGASGTGKTSAARILAAALNCESPVNGDCCGECQSCREVQAGSSLSVHEIDAASNGGVDEIRSLQEMARFATGGSWRVILLDEAHAMSKSAFNALLKTLEEPPSRTVFVLLTTEPEKIMETVRSRSMPIDFRPIPKEAVRARLQTICTLEKLDFPADLLAEITESSEGGLREAVRLLDQAQMVGITSVESLRLLTGRSTLPSQILQAVIMQEHARSQSLLQDFFCQSADVSDLITSWILDLQKRFDAGGIQVRQFIAATKLLWDARTLSRVADRTTRSQIEALVTLLYAVFRVEERPKNPSPPPPILSERKSPKSVESPAQPEVLQTMEEIMQVLSE